LARLLRLGLTPGLPGLRRMPFCRCCQLGSTSGWRPRLIRWRVHRHTTQNRAPLTRTSHQRKLVVVSA